MGRKRKPIIPPKPRTALEHIAAQTGTDASEWRYVSPGTTKYKQGFHYWNPSRNLYAKRNKPENDSAAVGGTLEAGSAE